MVRFVSREAQSEQLVLPAPRHHVESWELPCWHGMKVASEVEIEILTSLCFSEEIEEKNPHRHLILGGGGRRTSGMRAITAGMLTVYLLRVELSSKLVLVLLCPCALGEIPVMVCYTVGVGVGVHFLL